ncbi:uncharacterized protein [Branchiostoma lanceolatum]|uniref:uncharacterized protein n=1 Tax=Branchiostoma lanceolatum TaxID=7740 RepID=UPI003455FDEE
MASTTAITIPQSAEDIAPSWVQQVLQKDLPGVIITDVHVKGSISEGEGYVSDIIAFDAMGTRNDTSQRYSLVAKVTNFIKPLVGFKLWSKDIQINIETIETKFYANAVPELLSVAIPSTEPKSQAEKEDDPLDDSWFLPKCYFAATDPSSMVSVRVMENLKAQGFSIKPDHQPLSREEMMLAVGALAQLHGLSHRLELRSGKPLPEKYDWIISPSDDTAIAGMDILNHDCQDSVKEFAAAFPDQADLVARLEKLRLRVDLEEPRLKVFCHGDCWINNIMFEYAGNVPTGVKLVDWQTPIYMPPTYDLTLLFLCNASWDVFHNHRDAILAHYHRKLQETLGPKTQDESSGLWSYTLEQLTVDFKADCREGVINRFIRLGPLPADADLLRMLHEIKEWGVI